MTNVAQRTAALVLLFCLAACATSSRESVNAKILASGSQRVTKGSDSSNYLVTLEQSTDATYGYSEDNPINVGGARTGDGPNRERRYLLGLKGPKGQELKFYRVGSCCAFEDERLPFGGGLLDVYEVTYDGLESPVILYLNLYVEEDLSIPVGFVGR